MHANVWNSCRHESHSKLKILEYVKTGASIDYTVTSKVPGLSQMLNSFPVMSLSCQNISCPHTNLGGGREEEVCILFSVEKLDSGGHLKT